MAWSAPIVNSTTLKAVALGISMAVAGCSADATGPDVPPAAPSAQPAAATSIADGNTGSVGLRLTLPNGSQIATVDWTIAGPNGAPTVVQSGVLDVHASAGISFQVSNIPAASGYQIVLSAAPSDGGASCEGSATFGVMSHATTDVDVQLICTASTAGGHTTVVNGTSFNCAAWGSVDASPIETSIGGTPVTLAATASGPAPASLTYNWSAPTGQFSSATAANTTFACTEPGPVAITLVVGDGPVPAGSKCNSAIDSDTITVTCTGTSPPPPPPPSQAPALPPWALVALALAAGGLGARATRRRSTTG